MCVICNGAWASNIGVLVCCPDVVELPPDLPNLYTLCCQECPLITTIPASYTGLKTLICSNCPQLIAIPPTLINLQVLRCGHCPKLTCIPATLTELADICCYNCPQIITIPPTLSKLQVNTKYIPNPLLPIAKAYEQPPSLTTLTTSNFIKWSQTRLGSAYCYQPTNSGGRLAKRNIALTFL